MEIYELKPLSICDTNSFIVATEKNNAVLIDAPADADYILREIEERGLTLKKILLTHGHFDHIGAVADLYDKTGCEVYIHRLDLPKLSDDTGMLSNYFRVKGMRKFDKALPIEDGDIILQDELEFDVVHTPGHTSGSVCFIVGNVMFSGDTLFSRSIGRTDMPDGDMDAMRRSLKIISGLGGDLRVLPGHMNETTLSHERRYNYYLKQASEAE